MKKAVHSIYLVLGHVLCSFFLFWWRLRDKICPPKETTVLIVAHPDDDTLFFHTFLKEKKPYVALMTTGWSLRRLPCFMKAMRYYGVRFRAYALRSRDTRTSLLEKHVREVLRLTHFELCATHNAEGEYGHEMHIRVHNAVAVNATCPIVFPTTREKIECFPIPEEAMLEKEMIFRQIYTTELFVIDMYSEWVRNEHLEEDGNQCSKFDVHL